MQITLRPAVAKDIDWLEPFYEGLMRPYVELTHSWSEVIFRESFNHKLVKIIQCDGSDIGMIKVEKRARFIFLGDIQIFRKYQNKGIGRKLITDVLEQARKNKLPVKLRVLKGNPAIRLYRRLGFKRTSTLTNCHEMTWNFKKNATRKKPVKSSRRR